MPRRSNYFLHCFTVTISEYFEGAEVYTEATWLKLAITAASLLRYIFAHLQVETFPPFFTLGLDGDRL